MSILALDTLSDSVLWIGLGILSLVAIKTIAIGLDVVVQSTEIKEYPDKSTAFPAAAEDAIKLDSLKVLASCNNVDVRQAATKLLCDRFLNSVGARRLLSNDIESDEFEVQDRAKKTIKLLLENATKQQFEIIAEDQSIRDNPRLRDLLPSRLDARLRPSEESPEERTLRRRRREAMVLNEGGPVSQHDIIQRSNYGNDTAGDFGM